MKQAQKDVKMKHFLFEFNHENFPASFEERVNILRNIGQQAKKSFEEKYHQLNLWFKEFDALYLLSFCITHFMAYEDGRDEEADKGHLEFPPHFIEILQALSLCSDQAITAKPLLEKTSKFKKDMREIGDIMLRKLFDIPENLKTEKELNSFHLRTEMMAHTIAVRGWAYDHQIKKIINDLCELIAEDFHKIFGLKPAPLFKLFNILIEKVNDKLNDHREKLRKVLTSKNYNDIFETYENEFAQIKKTTVEERDKMWEFFGKNLENTKAAMITHADLRLDQIYTFTAEEMASYTNNELSKEQIISVFDKLSYQFGELKDHNPEFFIMDNPVHKKPFIKLEDQNYFSSLWSILPHISIQILEELVKESKSLNSKYNDVRALYLENETEKLFKEHFPDAKVLSGCSWNDSENNKQFETDLLIIQEPFAIIVECKSGILTPAAKRGAPDRLIKNLQGLIEEPSEQALRFINFLKKEGNTIKLINKHRKQIELDKSKVKYFIPLGVTFTQLGIVGTNLKLLEEAGVTYKNINELITSINLPDLQIIFQILDSQPQKIHYLQKRREFELNNHFSGDEMDLLAFYLDTGFNLGKHEFEDRLYFNLVMKSKEIDPFILNKENGIESKKPILEMTTWFKDILSSLSLRKPETWLESSYVLLNFHMEEQKEFEKMYKDLVTQIKEKQTPQKHNWVIYSSINYNRRFMLFAYPYSEIDTKERNLMIEDILTHDTPDNTKGALLIAVNLNKQHYPYSALATKLSPELFDSYFSGMTVL